MFIAYILLPILALAFVDVFLVGKKLSLKYLTSKGFLLSSLFSILFCYTIITVTHLDFTAFVSFTPVTLFVAFAASFFFAIIKLMLASVKRSPKILSFLLLSLCMAVFLEGFIFNMRFYQTYYYEPINYTHTVNGLNNFQKVEGTDNKYTSNPGSSVYLQITDINKKIYNVHFDVVATDSEGNLLPIYVHTRFTDESNERLLSVPAQNVVGNVDSSKYLYLVTNGESTDITLSFSSDGTTYTVNEIALNVPKEFSFNFLRFLLWFVAIFIAFILRPSSSIYKHKMNSSSKQSIITSLIVCAEIALLIGITFFNPAFELFISSHHKQYNQLAEAFINGQLHLDIVPPDFLAQMDNPYDYAARDAAAKAANSTYYWDAAYFEGHYYVYFGVLPVILFYLPFKLIMGEAAVLPNRAVIQICLALFVVAAFALIKKIIEKYFRPERIPYAIYIILSLIFVNASGAVFIAKRPDFYSIPIILSLALVCFGLYFWLSSTDDPSRIHPWKAFFGSLCMASVAACRPQFLLVSVMAIVIFWDAVFKHRTLFSKKSILPTVAICLPYAIVAIPLMWYNYARFGSPFDFGQNYNLTTNDMTGRGIRFERVGLAFFTYFLQPPNITATFPFVTRTTISTAYLGTTITEAMFGGIFLTIPLLWILVKLPSLWQKLLRSKLVALAAVPLALSVFTGLFDAQGAGILQRYVADFAYLAILAAIIVFLFMYDRSRGIRSEGLNTFAVSSLYLSGLYCFLIIFAVYGSEIVYNNYPLFAKAGELIQFWR